jgi:hypothetical protein
MLLQIPSLASRGLSLWWGMIFERNLQHQHPLLPLSIELDDEPLLTCFLNHPILADNIQYPLDYNLIHERQLLDVQLILINKQIRKNFPLSIFMIYI